MFEGETGEGDSWHRRGARTRDQGWQGSSREITEAWGFRDVDIRGDSLITAQGFKWRAPRFYLTCLQQTHRWGLSWQHGRINRRFRRRVWKWGPRNAFFRRSNKRDVMWWLVSLRDAFRQIQLPPDVNLWARPILAPATSARVVLIFSSKEWVRIFPCCFKQQFVCRNWISRTVGFTIYCHIFLIAALLFASGQFSSLSASNVLSDL